MWKCVIIAKCHVSSERVCLYCWQHCYMLRDGSQHRADAYFIFLKIDGDTLFLILSCLLLFSLLSILSPCPFSSLLFYPLALQQQEQDPTNLYISNLPVSMDEQELENMLKPLGHVISTRILRDANGVSRGVGFARYTLIIILIWYGGICLPSQHAALLLLSTVIDFLSNKCAVHVCAHYTWIKCEFHNNSSNIFVVVNLPNVCVPSQLVLHASSNNNKK